MSRATALRSVRSIRAVRATPSAIVGRRSLELHGQELGQGIN
jgi:hypothetical protein